MPARNHSLEHWRPYNDPAYRAYRAHVRESGQPCGYGCGQRATTVDHIVPLARGGANDRSNWIPSCGRCNFSKGARVAPVA